MWSMRVGREMVPESRSYSLVVHADMPISSSSPSFIPAGVTSAIDIAPMADFDDEDDHDLVVDPAQHPIVADPVPP